MPTPVLSQLRRLDPRHSLTLRIIWLMIGLTAAFSLAASIWVGGLAREIVVQQHVRRLLVEADKLGANVSQSVNLHLDALRIIQGSRPHGEHECGQRIEEEFAGLTANFPELNWVAAADAQGRIVASQHDALPLGLQTSIPAWISGSERGAWLGIIRELPGSSTEPTLGDLAAPIVDTCGNLIGVVAARLYWNWANDLGQQPIGQLNQAGADQAVILDESGVVRVGPPELLDRPWPGVFIKNAPLPNAPAQFERLPDHRVVLVARAAAHIADGISHPKWQVQLYESRAEVYQRADALAQRIWAIAIGLGVATALIGALGARQLTARLLRLSRSAAAVGSGKAAHIEIPAGHDEVTQLAEAFSHVLNDLHKERSDLMALSEQLELRVAERTREIERLAAESRYAAVVRERLKIARDLHDTLAHSMMAMLSEVRLLRRLEQRNPENLREELERAESVAHEGLQAARSAIAQMRLNTVRDTGLGRALETALMRFLDHTGIAGEFHADPEAAGYGDERAETLFRMAEEALRNVEKHSRATRVSVTLSLKHDGKLILEIADDGIGFDVAALAPGHYGLIGLREQADLIGARLVIDSRIGGGTRLAIFIKTRPEF